SPGAGSVMRHQARPTPTTSLMGARPAPLAAWDRRPMNMTGPSRGHPGAGDARVPLRYGPEAGGTSCGDSSGRAVRSGISNRTGRARLLRSLHPSRLAAGSDGASPSRAKRNGPDSSGGVRPARGDADGGGEDRVLGRIAEIRLLAEQGRLIDRLGRRSRL